MRIQLQLLIEEEVNFNIYYNENQAKDYDSASTAKIALHPLWQQLSNFRHNTIPRPVNGLPGRAARIGTRQWTKHFAKLTSCPQAPFFFEKGSTHLPIIFTIDAHGQKRHASAQCQESRSRQRMPQRWRLHAAFRENTQHAALL
jgi:hypothetical protein